MILFLFILVMKTEPEVFQVIKKAPFTVVVVFICFFSIWSVIGLAGFHTYLTTSDQTTNEDVLQLFSFSFSTLNLFLFKFSLTNLFKIVNNIFFVSLMYSSKAHFLQKVANVI